MAAAAAAASAQDAQQMPFIKNLASSDRKLRTESLSSLQAFLSSRRSLSAPDARKLWTGLYYALWMTDRPRPQQALAADLAALLLDHLRPECAAAWMAGFWAVLAAQWPHTEALRLDKFLLLVRRVFAAQVRWARERAGFDCEGQEGEAARAVLRVLREWCFDAEDENRVALGLRLHVLDIWVDELQREGTLDREDPKARAFVRKIGDMVEALKRCPVKSVRQLAQETYEDERLPWAEVADAMDEDGDDGAENDNNNDDDDEWGGIDD